MEILKIILEIIVAIVAIFFIAGLFLPKTYTLTRTTVINAPDSVIYNNIADFNQFIKWNPWYKQEPSAKISVSGTPGQAGHSYTWVGKKMGQGQMIIREAQPYKLVDEELKFIKPMKSISDVKFLLEPAAGGVKVDWTMSGQSETIADKWIGAMMGVMMGKDFENGLKDLKDLSEKK